LSEIEAQQMELMEIINRPGSFLEKSGGSAAFLKNMASG